jgi:hypothetical protein
MAEVVEACLVSTEVWALLHATDTAQSILEVGINLDFLAEPSTTWPVT